MLKLIANQWYWIDYGAYIGPAKLLDVVEENLYTPYTILSFELPDGTITEFSVEDIRWNFTEMVRRVI